MQDELKDNHEYYHSILHGYCCDLLSTIKFKENRKRAETQINRLATSKVISNSDSNQYVMLPRNNMVTTSALTKLKTEGGKDAGASWIS